MSDYRRFCVLTTLGHYQFGDQNILVYNLVVPNNFSLTLFGDLADGLGDVYVYCGDSSKHMSGRIRLPSVRFENSQYELELISACSEIRPVYFTFSGLN